jgi:adenylate kinase family enzyme
MNAQRIIFLFAPPDCGVNQFLLFLNESMIADVVLNLAELQHGTFPEGDIIIDASGIEIVSIEVLIEVLGGLGVAQSNTFFVLFDINEEEMASRFIERAKQRQDYEASSELVAGERAREYKAREREMLDKFEGSGVFEEIDATRNLRGKVIQFMTRAVKQPRERWRELFFIANRLEIETSFSSKVA